MKPSNGDFKMKLFPTVLAIAITVFSSASTQVVAQDEFATASELKLMEGFPPPADKLVDRSNALMTPPFNRWSYLNMRLLYPTAGIANASQPIKMPGEIDKGIAGLKVVKPDATGAPTKTTVDMKTYLKETYTDALVVVQRDKIVFEKYFNGMDGNHPHQMMSVTKSFAGLFGLQAVADGKADEGEVVSKYLPELKASGAFRDATFEQVLNMTNAMDFSEKYADPNSGIQHYGVVLGLMTPQPGKTYANSIYEYLPTLKKDPAHEHGEIFHYQTPKTDVVNWVTNRVTGVSFQKNMFDKLWSKLGTDGETYVLLDKNATLFAGGGLNATPRDLARFGSMMISDGKFAGQQVISEDVIKQLSKGASTEAFANGPSSTGIMAAEDWSYRAQWWVRQEKGKEAFSAIGIHGQWIYCDIHRGVAIIKQSSQPTSADDYFDAYNLNAWDAIIGHLSH